MGTKLVGPFIKEENLEIPPGFESLVPFTLKRVEDNNDSSSLSSNSAPDLEIAKSEIVNYNDEPKTTASVRRRPWMKCNQFDSSCDELDLGQVDQVQSLPKGVIRGCEDCSNCQKVVAKWHPEEACRPELEEAPVFYPTEEEFEDTLKYISSIRAIGEVHGICRIVPPASWKPPCCLMEKNQWERSKFSTRIQRIDKLQNRHSMRKILQVNDSKKRKKRRTMKNGVDNGSTDETKFPDKVGLHDADRFGFVTGPEFTLDAFQKYANDFKAQYFRKYSDNSVCEAAGTMAEEQCQPSTESIEGEYWRMVEKPMEEIEVLYGADIETGVFGSGFPKKSKEVGSTADLKYIDSGWNLNNFPRLPGSVLSFESTDISGVLVPWLYIGMCFSSFCWHVEDHHLYSLNYMHWGSPKIWYGVPGSDALKLEVAMRKHLPDLFEEQPDLLHKLVTQLSPSILRREGVPVYRCVQKAGEFVLTFPRAYHAGFNCGFNCAEAVNVAPVDWLPHGQNAIDLYREQGRKTSISHDKLLLGAAREAVKANWEFNLLKKNTSSNLRWKDVCGKDGLLSKTLKVRVEKEQARREFLCKSSQALKMESSFDAISERECSVCFFDLHLSAAGCHNCSPNKYACLNHAKQLCSCSWGAKFFLFRYDINELNILVEALEGKLSAVYRWARLDLGLALSSYISKGNKQNPVLVDKLSHPDDVMAPKGTSLLPPLSGSKKQEDRDIINTTKSKGRIKSAQNRNPPMVVLALKNMKTSLKISSPKVVAKKNCSSSKKKSTKLSVKCEAPSQIDCLITPSTQSLVTKQPESDLVFCSENKEDVLPSGDEDDGPGKIPSIKNEISEKHTDGTRELICPDYLAGQGISTNNLISKTIVTLPSMKLAEAKICSIKDVPSTNVIPDGEKSSKEGSHKTIELDVESRSMENVKADSCSPVNSHTNLDRYYRQKGPRMAKVVRRINCNVEPLAFGAIHAGKLWCDSRAIYPNGFRSRVKYIDVLDPTNMCHYISEILDVGRDGPLFMVSMEHTPSEVFAHVSAARCWEMVRERVNHEIGKKHMLGRVKLPPLQPPGSLDGIEMFGFSSPTIVQAIQAMDQNRVCTEYWKSRPLMQIPQQPNSVKSEAMNQETQKSQSEVESILTGLLNKASQVELQTLYNLISNNNSTDERSILTQLLNKEIQKHTS